MSEFNKNKPLNIKEDINPKEGFQKGPKLPNEIIIPIIDESCENRKELLESKLLNGRKLSTESEFNSFVKLLRHNGVFDIKANFHEINEGREIIIIREPNAKSITVYMGNSLTIWTQNRDLGKLGVIEENGVFKIEQDGNRISFSTDPKNAPPLIECKKKEIPPSKPPETKKPDLEYTIKKRDSLWKIIEEHYDLNGSDNKERDIANIVKRLGKDKRNKKAIQDSDTIFTGEKLYLPNPITINYTHKKGDNKKIPMKEKEAK